MSNKLERKYGLFTAICMVVGIVIGSGVFFKAQNILEKTGGDLLTGIIAWIIGGAIMLACLLAFSAMGQKYEKVNGIVDYAEATVGSWFGYLMGWFSATIYYPGMTSVLAWVSARYTLVFLTTANPSFPMIIPAAEGGCLIGPECMILALLYLALTYGINALSPKLAGKFQTSTTVIKLIPLGLMMVVGLIYGLASGILQENMVSTVSAENTSGHPLFAAVCSTAFAYEGWIIATSINSELKNSKKNLPKALTIGGIIIVAVYLFYFIGVAGGATTQELISSGATTAFTNIFGRFLGNVMNLFIAVSCLGTLNGLMVGCSRGMYSIAARGEGPKHKVFSQVDNATNMANNSAVFALLVTAAWLAYFFFANLWGGMPDWATFDSSELPIITIYFMYLPILIMWMVKEKDQGVIRRFVLPILAMCGSIFMVVACAIGHRWDCITYLVVFAVIMVIGVFFYKPRKR